MDDPARAFPAGRASLAEDGGIRPDVYPNRFTPGRVLRGVAVRRVASEAGPMGGPRLAGDDCPVFRAGAVDGLLHAVFRFPPVRDRLRGLHPFAALHGNLREQAAAVRPGAVRRATLLRSLSLPPTGI